MANGRFLTITNLGRIDLIGNMGGDRGDAAAA
jgi:hypothetical protein